MTYLSFFFFCNVIVRLWKCLTLIFVFTCQFGQKIRGKNQINVFHDILLKLLRLIIFNYIRKLQSRKCVVISCTFLFGYQSCQCGQLFKAFSWTNIVRCTEEICCRGSKNQVFVVQNCMVYITANQFGGEVSFSFLFVSIKKFSGWILTSVEF